MDISLLTFNSPQTSIYVKLKKQKTKKKKNQLIYEWFLFNRFRRVNNLWTSRRSNKTPSNKVE